MPPPTTLQGPACSFSGDPEKFLEALRTTPCTPRRSVSYAQGFMPAAAQAGGEYGWDLDYGRHRPCCGVEGCIIRAAFLGRHHRRVRPAARICPASSWIGFFTDALVHDGQTQEWRRGRDRGGRSIGIPVPAYSSALELLRQPTAPGALPANLIQAQRDYFGAHTYGANRPPGRVPHRMAGRRAAAGATTKMSEMTDKSYVERTFGLQDQVVALAGGGGTIALALAEAFLEAGARVAIWSRRQETVDAALERLGSDAGRRGRLCGVQADAGQEAAVDAALEATVAALGAPTVLLNGVGGNRGKGAFNDIDVPLFEEVLRLNLVAGLVVPTKRTAAFWIARGSGGCIINVASMASYVPLSGVWAYNAAKAGVVNLTMACAKEYAAHGIRVNAIAPGVHRRQPEPAPADQGRCHRRADRARAADHRPHAVRTLRGCRGDDRCRPVPGQRGGCRLHHRRHHSHRRWLPDRQRMSYPVTTT